MVAMFFGLRLVCTAALTQPILGATVIKTPVQASMYYWGLVGESGNLSEKLTGLDASGALCVLA